MLLLYCYRHCYPVATLLYLFPFECTMLLTSPAAATSCGSAAHPAQETAGQRGGGRGGGGGGALLYSCSSKAAHACLRPGRAWIKGECSDRSSHRCISHRPSPGSMQAQPALLHRSCALHALHPPGASTPRHRPAQPQTECAAVLLLPPCLRCRFACSASCSLPAAGQAPTTLERARRRC